MIEGDKGGRKSLIITLPELLTGEHGVVLRECGVRERRTRDFPGPFIYMYIYIYDVLCFGGGFSPVHKK